MPMIDLDAAIAIIAKWVSPTYGISQTIVHDLRALPTVQPEPAPALGAEWMRGEAEKAILALWQWDDEGWQTHRPNNSEARAAILAIPGPTRAQLLADALAMPEVKALVVALDWMCSEYDTGGDGYDARCAAHNALAKLKGGA